MADASVSDKPEISRAGVTKMTGPLSVVSLRVRQKLTCRVGVISLLPRVIREDNFK